MPKKHNYEIGKVYGVKKLISLFKNDNSRMVAEVECVNCGNRSFVRPCSLFNAKYTSCRCMIEKVLGLSDSRIYGIYSNMKDRCNNPNCCGYHNYGGKGISVADEWLGESGFLNFYGWSMTHGYQENLTIDRIDSSKNYCPENCRWITKSENTAYANRDAQHRHADKGTYYGILDGNMFIFDNANKFAREHNLNPDKIRACARKDKYKNGINGWMFGYISDLQNYKPQSTIESVG